MVSVLLSLQVEMRKDETEQSEQRAKHAQAEASDETTNTIGNAYEAQATRGRSSRYLWTILALFAALVIVAVNAWIMKSVEVDGSHGWSQRIDSIITRLLCTSILGGMAYWAGRIATIKLGHGTDHLHKAVIAQTLGSMKEGAETMEAREKLGLMAHARLLDHTGQPQSDRTGPVTGDPGPHIREGMAKATETGKDP